MTSKTIPTILIDSRIHIPSKHVDDSKLDKLYRTLMFEEKLCNKCEYKPDRPCDVCHSCDGFGGDFKLYKSTEINGKSYVSVPTGNDIKLNKLLKAKKFKIQDNRDEGKSFAKIGLEFETTNLYKYQKKSVRKMIEAGNGLIQSAPRTGKTVMAAALTLSPQKSVKTLIMAHQEDLLKQFVKTFRDPLFTNISEMEKINGKQYVGICRTLEDFKKYRICLVTYQLFLSPGGKKLLAEVAKLPFGMLIVDEIHRASALCYSIVVNSFKCRNRYGLSATPKRKDGMHFVIRDIVGPIIYRTKAKPMKLEVDCIETGMVSRKNYKNWTYALNFLSREPVRNKKIVSQALKDLKLGHSIVIPIERQEHADHLVQEINRRYGSTIAGKFTGNISKVDRPKILARATSGKIMCTVAMRSMLTGVNIPKWSCIYQVMPMNNEGNLEQILLRVCTPLEGKIQPVVRWFLDDFSITRSCFRSSVGHMKKFRKRLGGFHYTERGAELTHKHLTAHFARQKSSSWDDASPAKPFRDDFSSKSKSPTKPRSTMFDRKPIKF